LSAGKKISAIQSIFINLNKIKMEKEKRKKYLNEAEKRGYKFTSETIKILDESHPIQSSIGANVEINLRYKFLGLSFIKSKYMGFKESFENQANEIFEDVAFKGDEIIIPSQNNNYFFIGISIPPTANLALDKLEALHDLSREFKVDA
tara:strand:+ start:72 stop:515 length:444 start_codon:yes stop_codon:yes gene_type:complete